MPHKWPIVINLNQTVLEFNLIICLFFFPQCSYHCILQWIKCRSNLFLQDHFKHKAATYITIRIYRNTSKNEIRSDQIDHSDSFNQTILSSELSIQPICRANICNFPCCKWKWFCFSHSFFSLQPISSSFIDFSTLTWISLSQRYYTSLLFNACSYL